MTNNSLLKLLKIYGPDHQVSYVRFAPTAYTSGTIAMTLTEAQGVTGVSQTAAGLFTVTLAKKPKALVALVSLVENDTTLFHFARVESSSASAGTVNISHKSVAYASVASGPALSDTVDELVVVVISRMVS